VSDPTNIDKIISRVRSGELRIPGFQRPFVWEPQQAALLMDSIYKGYPFGSILLWRTGNVLKTERRLGGFSLPPPEKDYPIDYVLDGQQRITSLFATFQNDIASEDEDPEVWLPIYYDFEAERDIQDPQFVALPGDSVDANRHFPLRTFFHPVNFSRSAQQLPESRYEAIVTVQQKFVAATIPVQTFESEDRASVAIVFERVNRLGVELDMFQLLTAWTWSDEFDLQERFRALSEEFAEFGFADVGSDSDLMLRCAAAVLVQDPTPTALIDVNGAEVRARFEEVATALRLAVDFVRTILLLAARQPRSFLSGSLVDLDAVLAEPNRREYHHCFPQKYLLKNGIETDSNRINCLANIAFISRADNRTILDKAPSVYRGQMPQDISQIAEAALLPDKLFHDDWKGYRGERAKALVAAAQSLLG
jgi:hypothetical protein